MRRSYLKDISNIVEYIFQAKASGSLQKGNNMLKYTRITILNLPTYMSTLAQKAHDNLELRPEKQKIRKLKVTKVYPSGIFLEDGGFVHVTKISDYHLGSHFMPGEIGEWYPVGSTVFVKLEKKEKLLNGKERIFYDFMGPADVIDVKNEEKSADMLPAQKETVKALNAAIEDKKAAKLWQLADKREAGEIEKNDFDIYNWLNSSDGRALTRGDLGNQAVVLSSEEFRYIGVLTILRPDGKECELDADDYHDNDVLIIYPGNLG